MKDKDFNALVERRCDLIRSVLSKKQAEYSARDDRLIHFKNGARIAGETPEKTLKLQMVKHITCVFDLLDNPKKDVDRGYLDEKIGDTINYLILFEAMVVDRLSRVRHSDGQELFLVKVFKSDGSEQTISSVIHISAESAQARAKSLIDEYDTVEIHRYVNGVFQDLDILKPLN